MERGNSDGAYHRMAARIIRFVLKLRRCSAQRVAPGWMKHYVSSLLCARELDDFFCERPLVKPVTLLQEFTCPTRWSGGSIVARDFLCRLHRQLAPDGDFQTFCESLCRIQSQYQIDLRFSLGQYIIKDTIGLVMEMVGTQMTFCPQYVPRQTRTPPHALYVLHDYLTGRDLRSPAFFYEEKSLFAPCTLVTAALPLHRELFTYTDIHHARVEYFVSVLSSRSSPPPFLQWVKTTTAFETHAELWAVLRFEVYHRVGLAPSRVNPLNENLQTYSRSERILSL